MNWKVLENDRAYVLKRLREGTFEGLEMVTRVLETQFFESLLTTGDLQRLAASYPTPRKREDVPLWLYLSSELSLRIHASHGFKSMPHILSCSGLKDALRNLRKPRKGGMEWSGFNAKNAYARETPCDQDFLRKLARDTKPQALEAWYNTEVARYYQSMKVYDPDGIFIADGTYLFVPDNPRYQHSHLMRVDAHNHPVSKKAEEAMGEAERKRLRWVRCYKKVALIHTSWRDEFYLYTALRTMPGNAGESPVLGDLVDGFVRAVGKGVMKILIHDRGFLDGAMMSRHKTEYGIDAVFPLKRSMHCWDEAWRLAEASEEPWIECETVSTDDLLPPHERPDFIQKREERRQKTVNQKRPASPRQRRTLAKWIPDLRIWDAASVPIHVLAMRDIEEDGSESAWVLATTKSFEDPLALRACYRLRPAIEERFRQTKCFWDLTGFRSPNYALVVNQVVFVLMAYSLVQIFLLKTGRKDLARKTRERLLQELLEEQGEQIAIHCDGRTAFLDPLEYQEILLSLEEHARRKVLGATRSLRAEKTAPPDLPWRP